MLNKFNHRQSITRKLKSQSINDILENKASMNNTQSPTQTSAPTLPGSPELTTSVRSFDSPAFTLIVKIIVAILIVIIFIRASKRVSTIVKQKLIDNSDIANQEHSEKIANLIGDIVFYTLIIFSFFIGFQILGFDVAIIIGGISFGVGLAFKEILGNMIAGIMILSTKQINIGDIIEVKDTEDYFGRIEEITIRNTVIRTLDMRQVVLPNMTLIRKPIKTYSAEDIVRVDGIVQVDYETDLPFAQKVMVEAINTLSFVKEPDKTKSLVWSFDDSGISLKYFFYFDPQQGLIQDYAKGYTNEVINKTFKENKISIPFPHRTLVTKEGANPVKIESITLKKQQSDDITPTTPQI